MKSCMLFINLVQVGAAVGALCVNSKLVQCASLKSNMGHLEASAAAAGLVSLVLVPFDTCAIAGNAQLNRLVMVPYGIHQELSNKRLNVHLTSIT